jgi:hypothetical protein
MRVVLERKGYLVATVSLPLLSIFFVSHFVSLQLLNFDISYGVRFSGGNLILRSFTPTD